jgi:hypothetical protein
LSLYFRLLGQLELYVFDDPLLATDSCGCARDDIMMVKVNKALNFFSSLPVIFRIFAESLQLF